MSTTKSMSHKNKIIGNWLKAAAVLLLTFGLGYFIANDKKYNNNIAKTSIDISKLDLSKINSEMGEAENYYLSNIKMVTQEVKSFQKEQPELVMEFLMDDENLENVYKELKQNLIDNADNEQILNLMIQNLQMRTEVLNEQKRILQKIVNLKSSSNGKTIL